MNETDRRKELFQHLDDILEVSQKKFSLNNKKDKERRSWARISIQAINSYGKLLDSVELDRLMEEITEIKQHLNLK